tara:strand:+ start:6853 stop:7344 length:492 start_codon:yes stop_codon:yes gene_type:complete
MSKNFNQDELVAIEHAESKWFPVIFQSYSTSVLDMMASPAKKGFLMTILFMLCAQLYINFSGMKKQKNINLYMLLSSIFVFGLVYYGQWRQNENLKEVALRSEDRLSSKQFDFLNNMVVQGEMFRGGKGGGGFLESASNIASMASDAYVVKSLYDSRKSGKRK